MAGRALPSGNERQLHRKVGSGTEKGPLARQHQAALLQGASGIPLLRALELPSQKGACCRLVLLAGLLSGRQRETDAGSGGRSHQQIPALRPQLSSDRRRFPGSKVRHHERKNSLRFLAHSHRGFSEFHHQHRKSYRQKRLEAGRLDEHGHQDLRSAGRREGRHLQKSRRQPHVRRLALIRQRLHGRIFEEHFGAPLGKSR